MPDKRKHRGPHPEDAQLFSRPAWPVLQRAVAHLSWLLTRGYAEPSALKLVGDRFQLDARQRLAVRRAACSDQALRGRLSNRMGRSAVAGRQVAIDGFNLLTTIEAAIAGGVLLDCRDSCVRDMASMHGNYRKVAETLAALQAIACVLSEAGVLEAVWWLDRPVSNSGRLGRLIEQLARRNRWTWSVQLATDVDRHLRDLDTIVISADSGILDHCRAWTNITPMILERLPGPKWRVPLDHPDTEE